MDQLIGEEAFRQAAMGKMDDLFGVVEPPVVIAWGMGVDSTALILGMMARGERIDAITTADTGDEKPETYDYRAYFMEYMRRLSGGRPTEVVRRDTNSSGGAGSVGGRVYEDEYIGDQSIAKGYSAYGDTPIAIVRYEPKKFKNFPRYSTLAENCFTNGTLPSISFGMSSCSQKWKIQPQDAWVAAWEPAQRVWAGGGKVIKCIGYDAGPRDSARYAQREGHESGRYLFRTPLREWGWDREECERQISAHGLRVPPKSACFMCAASKPWEIRLLNRSQLARIVAMEARAAPRLHPGKVEGLWRKTVKGHRGATPKPGRMTDFIRAEGLLPGDVIDRIAELVPKHLTSFMEAAAGVPLEDRPTLRDWMEFFLASPELGLDAEGDRLYEGVRSEIEVARGVDAAAPGLAA